MKQDKFQLAKEYEEQITRIREELSEIDKTTHLELRAPYNMSLDCIPSIARDLNDFPRLKAAVRAALEDELQEYVEKFNKL